MRENGLYTKTNQCTWTSTHEFPDNVVTDETGERVNRTSGDEGFKALGAKITMVGDDNAELNNRLHKAWQAFYKHKNILCQKNTNVNKRLLLMERIITPGVFWGAGSWNLREQDIKKLQACQNTMHRMIVGIANVDHAHLDAALKKAYQEVHHWRISTNIETWTHKLSHRRFRWAGHVARMNDNRPAKKILMWRGSAWLKQQEHRLGRGRQGHRRHVHVRRWESWIARWRPDIESDHKADISHEWMDVAQDRIEWCRHAEKHADWTNTGLCPLPFLLASRVCAFWLTYFLVPRVLSARKKKTVGHGRVVFYSCRGPTSSMSCVGCGLLRIVVLCRKGFCIHQ